MSDRLRRGIEAFVIFAVVTVLLAATAHSYGLGYDEPVYMSRTQDASAWLRMLRIDAGYAVSDEGIRRFWDARNEQQPGFIKLWGAVATPLVEGILPPLAALRFGTHLLVGMLCASIYLLVASVWGRLEALAAVGALLTLPRTFAHSHLFALDAPVMAATFISLHFFYLCARDRSWWWAAAGASTWGVALSLKVNAFFVPVIVFPWLLVFARDSFVRAAVCSAVLGPALFIGTWPWLWYETISRAWTYTLFHARHWQIHVTYFGERLAPAPWHYPLVMTAITTPVATIAAVITGAVRMAREGAFRLDGAGWRERWQERSYQMGALIALIAWALFVNYLLNSLPSTPKYNGVRLFQPVFPLLAIVAGVGIGWLARAAADWFARQGSVTGERMPAIAAAVVVALALALPLRATVDFHPHQLSYYNALIGGLPGAEARGMEVTYWADTYLHAAWWLNEHAPEGSLIWIEPPGIEATMRIYRELGVMRRDVASTAGEEGFAHADYAVFQNKSTEFSDLSRGLLATQEPVATIDQHGVPLLFIFELKDGGEAE